MQLPKRRVALDDRVGVAILAVLRIQKSVTAALRNMEREKKKKKRNYTVDFFFT